MPKDFRTYKVSRGEGEESYTLRLLLHIAPDGKFPKVDALEEGEELELVFGDRPVFISKSDLFYILRAPGFPLHAEAEAFVSEVKATFFAFLLRRRISIFVGELQEVDTSEGMRLFREGNFPENYEAWPLREDGTLVDGGIHLHTSVIIPEHQRIVHYPRPMYGKRKISIENHVELVKAFEKIKNNYEIDSIIRDDRLIQALNVYAAAYAQVYPPITYLNLVVALEILARSKKKATVNEVEVLDKLIAAISDEEKAGILNEQEANRLRNGIGNLKSLSISAAMRRYVTIKLIEESCHGIPPDQAETMVDTIYHVRSGFAHDGTMSIRDGYDWTFGYLHGLVRHALIQELNKHLKAGHDPPTFEY